MSDHTQHRVRFHLRKFLWFVLQKVRLAFVTLLLAGHALGQSAENRTALVVGCDYRGTGLELPSPARDANALSTVLRDRLGFQVVTLLNPTRRGLIDAIDDFGAAVEKRGGVGLFYFSGHGAQHEGENYLIPTGAVLRFREDLPTETVAASRVLTRTEAARNPVNLIFLDACRNNELPSSKHKDVLANGLTGMQAVTGMLIGFATAKNNVANDSGSGSIYTNALLKHIATPGLSVMDMLTRVNNEVRRSTDGSQVPFMEVGLSDVFYFVPPTSAVSAAPRVVPEPIPTMPPRPEPLASLTTPAPLVAPAVSSKTPFTNSLGMKFVPILTRIQRIPKTLFYSIWETRVQDYGAFVKATGRSWEKPPFPQTDTHPAVRISWNDATAFCEWLTEREHHTGTLPAGARYRLPSDLEWSWAVGLEEEYGNTPALRDCVVPGYPWGDAWPPPKGAGNYDPSLHTDSFPYTSPVGSFAPNRHGLYDLGGNAYEWVSDYHDESHSTRTVRGASWADGLDSVMSSLRFASKPDARFKSYGFRCVIDNLAP
jgi:hypothetical protein